MEGLAVSLPAEYRGIVLCGVEDVCYENVIGIRAIDDDDRLKRYRPDACAKIGTQSAAQWKFPELFAPLVDRIDKV